MKSLLSVLILLLSATLAAQIVNLQGAWVGGTEENRITMIIAGSYFSAVVQNTKTNTYIGTCGGSWRTDKNTFIEVHEFNTMMPDWVGTERKEPFSLKGDKLTFTTPEKVEEFVRIDNGKPGELAGAWLITGRLNGTEMQTITPGARKTMKILSGTRFQWIAYNSETKEFVGTGGGTYTTQNGKYTEHILFFPRDNTRVGVDLTFDFALEAGNWHHKGLSSKGTPIDEVWTRREKIGK